MSETPRSFSIANAQGHSPAAGEQGSLSAEERRRKSRRGLFRAVLSGAPLILTLPNRSAWGQTGGNGTNVTPISAAKKAGLSEEQIEQLRQQLQQAEKTGGAGWLEDPPSDLPEP
ncbi:MAG TPA: hypothetical protein PK777_03215 [Thermoguttaceae bacterium]|nr:hypothetical protein [Thermoguttaceae bacterium]HPP51936.1 hypothetical protein [Thermoguttaceae bacterium]